MLKVGRLRNYIDLECILRKKNNLTLGLHCDFRKNLVALYSQGENLPRQVPDMAVYSNTKAEPHMFQVSIRIY